VNEHLAAYVRQQRLRQGITLQSLARTVAPDNVRKTAGRIGRFEAEGIIREELLAAVSEALGIAYPTVEAFMHRDWQESFFRGDPPHPAEPRRRKPERKNPTPTPSKTPA
jgi:hypothetical protein